MDCREARRLIDEGVTPGGGDPQRVQLGFHISGCANCRTYLEAPEQRLLLALLAQDAAKPPMPVAAPSPEPVAQSVSLPATRSAALWLRYGVIAAAVLLLLVGSYFVGRAAYAAYTIQQNFQAMQIQTSPVSAAEQLASSPLPSEPTSAQVGVADTAVMQATPLAATTTAATPLPGRQSTLTPTPIPLGTPGLVVPSASAGSGQNLSGPSPGSAITVLLMGIDRRPGEEGPSRADTNIIVRIDPEQQRIAMLSIPRDLIVNIPGYGYSRINAAHSYGDYYPELGGGINLARQTVSELLGIPIDYVIQVDFGGFIGAIDAIGGVDINVEKELYDPEYPTMDYGYMVAHFLPGLQHMDGETALIYARVRHMDDNYQRNARQQQVILAMIDRLRSQNTFEQLQSVANLTTALREYIQTDLSQDRMIALAWAFRNFSSANVERYALDGNMVSEGVDPNDIYATYANDGAIEMLVDQLLHGPNG